MQKKSAVLVCIDDDYDFLQLYREIFEKKGYKVLCFSDPQKALKSIKKQKPQLVITDLMMGSLNSGFVFSRLLKQDEELKNIPVIIVTAIETQKGFNFSPKTPEDLKSMYADAYFNKPVQSEELIAKVEELLEGK